MTEPTQAGGSPAQSRVQIDPLAALGELQAENQYLRNRCLLLANELHALRSHPSEQPKDES